ncbi:hypothetical protein GUITHDRAFT_107473 [Guillardia theta CCMP2712]|uniref:Uncharacterized protein n=1 Tax=Guillardia theta (strain CCMP2712) TaxID=905079 RepID=L1JDU6_GUITC|nr:hypothetical protein GUITHDRAFT_107473 [Guillardia theta CCMP2712]EKX46691.1 hypothetical protein GUITHDRAFT_107473 [Guillardia theta CCMP2712]|eukprot:XP_005833671.1 hypothetical protein GUITHDRAFT_107473 [Guillardia theta CCMP2712]
MRASSSDVFLANSVMFETLSTFRKAYTSISFGATNFQNEKSSNKDVDKTDTTGWKIADQDMKRKFPSQR